MNRFCTLILTTMSLLLLGVALPAGAAAGQQKTLKEQLVGTWRVVSVSVERKDGSSFDPWGGKANGTLIFTRDGHFALINTRSGRPKFASGNRMEGTPEENKTTVQGALGYFGTYTVNEAEKTYSVQIVGSTYPNDEGTKQTRSFTIAGDELKFTNPAPTVGGSAAHVTLKRAK